MAPPRKRPLDLPPDSAARGRRLDALVQEQGYSNKEFARLIRRGETTAVKLRQGVTVPQEETLTAICKLFGVTPGWLLFGIAPKYAAPGATASVGAAPRQGSRGHPGLNAWINGTAEGRNTDTAERAWLRGCPWPEEIARAPNEAYSLALQAYRIAMHAREDEAG